MKNNYDAIKCDIEGGEFPLMEYFIKNPNEFNFKQGIFELHFWEENKTQANLFLNFIKLLKLKGYSFYFFENNNKKKIKLKDILRKAFNSDKFLTMMYFEKLN